jgi:hypothetical protein
MIAAQPSPVLESGQLERNLSNLINRIPNGRTHESLNRRLEREGEAYECFHLYVKAVDEDGIPGLQEIVLRPDLEDDAGHTLIGLDRLVDYWHEGGCFVDFRREWKTRAIWQARGEPELLASTQQQIKNLQDSNLDRTALATMPPARVNPRRVAGNQGRWDLKPGTKIPASSGDDTEFLRVPALDQASLVMESNLRRDAANLIGLEHRELPPRQGAIAKTMAWSTAFSLLAVRCSCECSAWISNT